MINENLLKSYKEIKCSLECAMYDSIDDLAEFADDFHELDIIKKKIGILASIIQDIDHTNKTIDVLLKLETEEQQDNG